VRAGIAALALVAAAACGTADRVRTAPPPFRGPGAPPRGNRLRLVIAPAKERITSPDSVVIRYQVSNEGLLLARAADEVQASYVGRQAGGRVFLFLETDDFHGDHARMQAAGLRFVEAPRHEPYGTVAVFEDLYGNRRDLLQPVD
jgi:hypothetical protein